MDHTNLCDGCPQLLCVIYAYDFKVTTFNLYLKQFKAVVLDKLALLPLFYSAGNCSISIK